MNFSSLVVLVDGFAYCADARLRPFNPGVGMCKLCITTFVVVLAVAWTGCDGPGRRDAGATTRDSAGVAIVESARPAWTPERAWRIDPEPLLQIGRMDGPPEYVLHRVRAAVPLDDGRIVVSNAGTNELRFYGPDGRFLLSAGRSGGGPGEFRALQQVWRLPGDSLLAYDLAPPRLSVFSPSGEFVRSVQVQSPDGRQVLIHGPLSDRSLVVEGAPVWDEPGAATEVFRDLVPYFRYDADGTLLDTIGRFPAMDVFRLVTPTGVRLTNPPFSRVPARTVAGDRFYFAPADRYEIAVHSQDHGLERLIRLDREPRPVTAAEIAAFRAERMELATREGSGSSMADMLRQMAAPTTMPAHSYAMLVDPDGHIWVEDYRASPDEDRRWRVFSPTGEYLGEVHFPVTFEPLHIGTGSILGRWLDDADVEYVRAHRLLRP